MGKKGYLQISFGWMFALFVGAFIIFIAIYASSNVIEIGRDTHAVKTGKEISILLNPLETGFETGKTNSIKTSLETKIYNRCNDFGNFGTQGLSVLQKSMGDWNKERMQINFKNKYLFSEESVQGKKFYLFSKPFEFPYKVADLIYLTSEQETYCFTGLEQEGKELENIKRELNFLDQKNLNTTCSNEELNSDKTIKVCFSNSRNCDVIVDYNEETIKKEGEIIRFKGNALMYAGIFSGPEIYECEVKRLVKRTANLARIYRDKAQLNTAKGCNFNINLNRLISSANGYSDSANLRSLYQVVEEMKNKNNLAECKLW